MPRIDDVKLTPGELDHLAQGGIVRKQTEQGEPLWFYGESSDVSRGAQPQGTWAVPVGRLIQDELRSGGKSGYAGSGYPFLLDIQLRD